MSADKQKYFEVTTVSLVRANNKTDAEAIARGRRGLTGSVVEQDTWVERILASQLAK